MIKRLLLVACLLSISLSAIAADYKISDINVDGNKRVEASSILAAVPFKPGQTVSAEQIDLALHQIFALGRFDDVAVNMATLAGGQQLTFVVHELPLIRKVSFDGNKKLKVSKLRPLLAMRIPAFYDRQKVADSVAALKKAYVEEGYHAASITPELVTTGSNEATLEFRVDEGKKVLIRDLNFVGNKVLRKKELVKKIETRERWALSWLTGRGTYESEAMELDVERIKVAYQDIGYQDVKVKPAVVTLVDDRYLDVTIEIEEGPQYKTGTVKVTGELLKSQPELLNYVTLAPGDVFGRNDVRESILALTDLYADHGYAYVNVTPVTHKNSTALTVDLELEVVQGVQVHIERIDINGNEKTRDKVIRREIPLVEGDLYSTSKMKSAKARVRNLGYFDEVNVTSKPGSSEEQTVVDVAVTERPTGTFSIGMGYSSVDKLIAQGSVTQDNFLGKGLKMHLSGSFGSTSNTYSVGLTDPYFMDTRWTLGFSLYKSEREYDDYDDYRTGGSIRAGHPVTDNSKAYLTYRYEQKELLDVTPGSEIDLLYDKESTLSSVTAEWVRNSTDYYSDPSSGGITKFSVEYAGLGGTEDFLKTIASHRHFFPLFWGTVFSVNGEIGYLMDTTDAELPITEKFFLGGINTLRGFETREVSPVNDDGSFIGAEKMAYFNFEYLFPIAKEMGLKGLLFYDTGNVWLEEEDYFTDMRHSAGAGIRWLSPLGPLRFEWGYNLDPRDDEKDSVFEFSIGKAF